MRTRSSSHLMRAKLQRRGRDGWQRGLLAVVGALLMAGCASTPKRPIQYPSSAKDWNGIDSIEFLQEFHLQDYSKLALEPMDTSATALPPQDENTYQPVLAVLRKTDSLLLTEISHKLKGKLEVAAKQSGATEGKGTLLLRGKVAEVHPGSQAARYWVGFGAGTAWVKISAEVVDAESDKPLLRFTQQKIGTGGMFGGGYEGILSDCVVAIGNDIGHMLEAFRAK